MGSMEEEVTGGRGGEKGKEKEEANLLEGFSSLFIMAKDPSANMHTQSEEEVMGGGEGKQEEETNRFKGDVLQKMHEEYQKLQKMLERLILTTGPGGYWKEKENKLTAVRYQGKGSSSSSGSPSYLGIKRTKVFCRPDGTETSWFEHEYQLLDEDKKKPGLVLQEDLVCRKVFKNCSRGDVARHLSKKSRVARWQRVLAERKLNQADLQSGEDPSGSRECLHACAPQNGETEDLREGGSSSRPSAPRNKESDVWQDFTKIYTKDPEVVHAVCNGCDRVFNAHSKIDGTSHLRRHREKCSSHNHRCWSAEDQKILQDLRQAHDLYKQEKKEINADLAKLDPSDPQSTSSYITTSLSRETHQGCWEEIGGRRTAIRTDHLPVSRPQYSGMKRTMRFHHRDGNKMAYVMIEIQLVDDYNPPCLFLRGAVVFRKVFQSLEDMVSDSFSELDRCLNAEDDEEEEHYDGVHEEEVQAYTTGLQDCLVAGVDQSRPGKRKRTSAPNNASKVWLHFTRIYNANRKRVYAVCHCCDKCLSGRPQNGTSHLWSHIEKCLLKYHEQPRQHNETGSANGTDTVWEAEIWAFVALALENYEETGEEIRTEAEAGNDEGDLGGCH